MLGVWFCEPTRRDLDIRQAETRSSAEFTGTFSKRAYQKCLMSLFSFVKKGRRESG